MNVLVHDAERNVYRVPALGDGVYAAPISKTEYAATGGQWSLVADGRVALDAALEWMLDQPVPHARLKRTDYGYLYEPWRAEIHKGVSRGGGYFKWSLALPNGEVLDIGKVESFRNFLKDRMEAAA